MLFQSNPLQFLFGAVMMHFDLPTNIFLKVALFKILKKIICSLSVLCSLFPMTYFGQRFGQNKSEARELEGLVKITYGFVASSPFKRAGNSN